MRKDKSLSHVSREKKKRKAFKDKKVSVERSSIPRDISAIKRKLKKRFGEEGVKKIEEDVERAVQSITTYLHVDDPHSVDSLKKFLYRLEAETTYDLKHHFTLSAHVSKYHEGLVNSIEDVFALGEAFVTLRREADEQGVDWKHVSKFLFLMGHLINSREDILWAGRQIIELKTLDKKDVLLPRVNGHLGTFNRIGFGWVKHLLTSRERLEAFLQLGKLAMEKRIDFDQILEGFSRVASLLISEDRFRAIVDLETKAIEKEVYFPQPLKDNIFEEWVDYWDISALTTLSLIASEIRNDETLFSFLKLEERILNDDVVFYRRFNRVFIEVKRRLTHYWVKHNRRYHEDFIWYEGHPTYIGARLYELLLKDYSPTSIVRFFKDLFVKIKRISRSAPGFDSESMLFRLLETSLEKGCNLDCDLTLINNIYNSPPRDISSIGESLLGLMLAANEAGENYGILLADILRNVENNFNLDSDLKLIGDTFLEMIDSAKRNDISPELALKDGFTAVMDILTSKEILLAFIEEGKKAFEKKVNYGLILKNGFPHVRRHIKSSEDVYYLGDIFIELLAENKKLADDPKHVEMVALLIDKYLAEGKDPKGAVYKLINLLTREGEDFEELLGYLIKS